MRATIWLSLNDLLMLLGGLGDVGTCGGDAATGVVVAAKVLAGPLWGLSEAGLTGLDH